jgi:hypothetical protein
MAYGHDDTRVVLDDMAYGHDDTRVTLDDMAYGHDDTRVVLDDMAYGHDIGNYYFENIVSDIGKNNLILENFQYLFLTHIETSLEIRELPLQFDKVDLQLTTYAGIKFVPPVDIHWESNDNLLSVGAFSTEIDAISDAQSKNYQDYDVKSILNQFGVVYYTYRVNFDNEIFCRIGPPAPIPSHGLIQGG